MRWPVPQSRLYSCCTIPDPRVDYLDRGKSAIDLPFNVSRVIRDLVKSVTKDWCRQRKREEREASTALERRDRLCSTRRVTIKDAAWEVMDEAYLKASGDGKLPAKARQIMYAARPKILAFTGRDTLDDKYFTQTLMVDYIDAHPDRCATWNVVWDARGTFSEPHTNREVPLGTLEVQQYLGNQPAFVTPTSVIFADHFPTSGPGNRFDTILYVEKEGFEPLLKAVRIAERFDVAIMTTKGMSVTAARQLLDRLSQTGYVRRILAMHDFDVSGFSIFGTLGTSNRRYKFESVVPLIDVGLRLDNVQAMSLESEPVVVKGNWNKRAVTLRRHGATEDEIAFLRNRRVELNSMTSRQIVDFIEAKFAEQGVIKLIPDAEIIKRHALRVRENQLMEEAIAKAAEQIAEQIAETTLPADLPQLIKDKLNERPSLSWDQALASIIRDDNRD
jgi:DNA topoisomerase 6 subunit A-like protein